MISEGEYKILVDAATELRIQCLKNKVKDLDAVLLTHSHADHVLGFDDLRHFNRKRKSKISRRIVTGKGSLDAGESGRASSSKTPSNKTNNNNNGFIEI